MSSQRQSKDVVLEETWTIPFGLVRNPRARPKLLADNVSQSLIEYYIYHTSRRLAGNFDECSPFVTHALTLAWSDDTLLHTILATSASHLLYLFPKYETLSKYHYGQAVTRIQKDVSKWEILSGVDRMALLASVLSLCWYEVRFIHNFPGPRYLGTDRGPKIVDCNPRGSLYHHLRATSHIFKKLEDHSGPIDQDLLGFYVEQYAYLAIVSNITLNPGVFGRAVEFDTAKVPLALINYGSRIYGFMFGYSHQLFETIPRIACLASVFAQYPVDREAICEFKLLERRILDWKPEESRLLSTKVWDQSKTTPTLPLHLHNDKRDQNLILAGLVYQQACLVYLYCCVHGNRRPDEALRGKIEECIGTFLELFSKIPHDCPAWTTTMWPIIVVGSCINDLGQRSLMESVISGSNFNMLAVERTHQLLRWIWDAHDVDDTIYGPNGIETLIGRKGFNICMG